MRNPDDSGIRKSIIYKLFSYSYFIFIINTLSSNEVFNFLAW